MRKVIKDNKVAIVLSKGCGSFYEHNQPKEWNYLPELVELVQSESYINLPNKHDSVDEYELALLNRVYQVRDCLIKAGWRPNRKDIESRVDRLKEYPDDYYYLNGNYYYYHSLQGHTLWDVDRLVVEWIDLNRPFVIKENSYGGDYILYQDEFNWEIISE